MTFAKFSTSLFGARADNGHSLQSLFRIALQMFKHHEQEGAWCYWRQSQKCFQHITRPTNTLLSHVVRTAFLVYPSASINSAYPSQWEARKSKWASTKFYYFVLLLGTCQTCQLQSLPPTGQSNVNPSCEEVLEMIQRKFYLFIRVRSCLSRICFKVITVP